MIIRKFITACAIIACAFCLSFPAHAAQPTEDYPIVKLQSLDKTTARTQTFEAKVGSTVKFGPLFIKVQACRKTSPIEQPESAAFLQIWQVAADETPQWIFSGWMFASSPGLSSMDHPIYDVWVLDCLQSKEDQAAQAEKEKLGVKTDDGEVKQAPSMPQQPDTVPTSQPAPVAVPEDSEADTGDDTPAQVPAAPAPTVPAPVPAEQEHILRVPPASQPQPAAPAPAKVPDTPAYDEGVY